MAHSAIRTVLEDPAPNRDGPAAGPSRWHYRTLPGRTPDAGRGGDVASDQPAAPRRRTGRQRCRGKEASRE
jgi:hypothetical protein